MIEGTFPSHLESLESVHQLKVGSNKLTGTLPDFSRLYPSLQMLDLSDNALIGSIPVGLSTLPFVLEIDLSDNQFKEGLGELGNTPQLNKLDVAGNKFSGPIPSKLGNLVGECIFLICTISCLILLEFRIN